MKALIYAAGYGTRLRPITLEVPKALVQVKGRPLLDWSISNLIQIGVNEIVINTHYLHDQIEQFIRKQSYSVPIYLSYEPDILGTGGGLYHVQNRLQDEPFLVCNADCLSNLSLEALNRHHEDSASVVTLAVNHRASDSMLLIDSDHLLVGIHRQGQSRILRDPIGEVKKVGFCGYHVISPEFFQYSTGEIQFSIVDQYLDLLPLGIKISTWDIKDVFWEDIGTPERLEMVNNSDVLK